MLSRCVQYVGGVRSTPSESQRHLYVATQHTRLTCYLITILCTFRHAKVMRSRVLSEAQFLSASISSTRSTATPRFTVATSRLKQINNQFSARNYASMSSSANPQMGDTSDPGKQNNELFKLENLFNVKPRVALVTGGPLPVIMATTCYMY